MNKKFNLIISILCIIEIICCFTPFCLIEEHWLYKPSTVYHGSSTLDLRLDINIFGNRATLGKPLAILFLYIAIAVAVIYFLKMLNHQNKIIDNARILAIAHTALMVIFLYYSCSIAVVDEISYRYEYAFNWMSYIIIALNLIILILAIILENGKVDYLPIKNNMSENGKKDSVDELLMYKELLDTGVISKEEFESKKKQILDL